MIADRRAFGPCTTRKGWELRRRVTPVDAALGPTEEALNRLAAAEPLSPDESDAPLGSDGNIVPKPADGVEVGALFEVVFGTVVVIFGSVVLTGRVVVTVGTVVVIFGSVVLTGRVVVTVGTVVVIFGSVVLTGSVVVIFGSVVLTGRVVVIVGSAVVMVRAGDADRPATAVLAT